MKLFLWQLSDALEAVVYFWEQRLDVLIIYTLNSFQFECLRPFWHGRVGGLAQNSLCHSCPKSSGGVGNLVMAKETEGYHWWDCNYLNFTLETSSSWCFSELLSRKKALSTERDLIAKRVREFRTAMHCILSHLEGMQSQYCCDEGVEIFWFRDDFEWSWIHHLMLQESGSSAVSWHTSIPMEIWGFFASLALLFRIQLIM